MKLKSFTLAVTSSTLILLCASAQEPSVVVATHDSPILSADAEYEAGKSFLHGRGVEKNPEKALEHFKTAADQGHIEAPGAIGYFYSVGLVVDKDDVKAAECFQKGLEKGSALAKFNLGRFYLDEKGGLSGRDTGLRLMEEAAASGLSEAHAALAEIYFLGLYCSDHKPDFTKAAPHVKVTADNGMASAINMLGVMKQRGLGIDEDQKGAEECFRKSAMKGDFKAQSNLGHLIDPDNKKRTRRIEATAWLILAASQNEPLASRKIVELEQSIPKKDFTAAREMADDLQTKIAEAGPK